MITREEVKKEIVKEHSHDDLTEIIDSGAIDYAYDLIRYSIGSCRECKHSSMRAIDMRITCKLTDEEKDREFYCGHFERKSDDS